MHWIHGPLGWTHGRIPNNEETNVVFFRGMSLDAITRGLLGMRHRPLAYGKGADWSIVMHDMPGWDDGDHSGTDYGRLCLPGSELAVFVTEPCLAKGHRPHFEYYRDGRLHTWVSFENLGHGTGEEPDFLLPALTEAHLVGPTADLDRENAEERAVEAITRFLSLPDLELP
ncbi:hypothetical protein [Streptomyces sp. SAI-229]|uniref:hypothetical protein n=1 Tax=Streptomyces sp. SAI-229 TaxID=3377731 RepID=UPI003C79D06C